MDHESLSQLLREDVKLVSVEPHIYTVASEEREASDYDEMSLFYDYVMGNSLYNRLMWGYRISELERVSLDSLRSAEDGWILDVGCGSLVFSARNYATCQSRPVALVDSSIGMLRRAKARMIDLNGSVPSNMAFIHGDALRLPFRPRVFKTVLAMNLVHVVEDVAQAVNQLKSVVEPAGALTLTTLVINNRFGDRYMAFLSKKGLITPRRPAEIMRVFDELGMEASHRLEGNMMFIHARERASHVKP